MITAKDKTSYLYSSLSHIFTNLFNPSKHQDSCLRCPIFKQFKRCCSCSCRRIALDDVKDLISYLPSEKVDEGGNNMIHP